MDGFSDLKDIVFWIAGLIDLALPVVGGLALMAFIWGLVKFISKSGDPKGNEEGKNLMIWGVVALMIMVSFKGLIMIAQDTVGIHRTTLLPYIKKN